MKPYWHNLTSFIVDSHAISTTILASLSTSLDLPQNSRFEDFHQTQKSSKTTAVMQCYPLANLPPNTSVGHFTHTDTGSITILFNTDWGLQVYNTPLSCWEYVPPKPGHAIINVGDALKFLSHQKLKSALHRVVPCPWDGRWVSGSRYALIYFLRPNNDAEFVDTEGNTWTADQWLDRKFGNYRSSHDVQVQTAIATGKKGFVGLWEGVTEKGTEVSVGE
jgi:isopenicillin N synthase-like dioxygenase